MFPSLRYVLRFNPSKPLKGTLSGHQVALGAVVDRTGLFPLMAADAEFMAGFPVEFDVPGRAVMTVGTGELLPVEPMVENYIAIESFVGKSRNADSPSEKQKHGDVDSFHARGSFCGCWSKFRL